MTEIINIGLIAGTFSPPKPLRGKELSKLPSMPNAWIRIENGTIHSFGSMKDRDTLAVSETIDATGRYILPCWCDSHTHLVFAASREDEFVDKIRGLSYADIAAKGGGILNSAMRLNATNEDELFRQAKKRLDELISLGTGAIEIKSGYGLTVEGEIKMLRVIQKLKRSVPIPVRATFLGAHAYPSDFREDHGAYIRQITEEMIPRIEQENLADYIDVFCENGFFSPEETEIIGNAGKKAGLRPRIHANQLSLSGGVEAGVKLGAISVDHLETMDKKTIDLLARSETIGTLLPTAAFFLRMPFQPARELIDSGAAVALASDFNPGSSPSGNMNLVVSFACTGMRMLPEEAINAATINGAFALEIDPDHGSIGVGKKANLILTKAIPSLAYLPYAFGTNHIDRVMINGEWL